MLLRAIRERTVDLSRSFLIGDKQTDLQAAQTAGVTKSHLFLGGDVQATI